jgi:hypothetical protein
MRVDIKVEGMEELKKELERMSEEKKVEIRAEVRASALDIMTQAKDNLSAFGAVDTGNLSGSIMVDWEPGGFTAEIGPEAPYGPHVEFGTKPHFPPPDALEAWARHHGFDSAWPICKLIAKRGIKARPYLLPAFLAIEREFFNRIKEILGR